MHRRTVISASVIALACLASAPATALGCVADVFTLDRLATESAHIVTATVSEVRSYWTPDHMTIETEVTLTGVDRITRDGATPEPDITYTVLGGTVGDSTLRVCCAPELRVGDQWVLFLQSTYRQYPVLGMERGMFRIEQVDGAAPRVMTSSGEPVLAIGQAGEVIVAAPTLTESDPSSTARQPRSIRGNISAVRVADREEAAIADRAALAPGLTLEDFLAQVRRRVPPDAARSGAVGPDIQIVRVAPALTPTPLRAADQNPGGAK